MGYGASVKVVSAHLVPDMDESQGCRAGQNTRLTGLTLTVLFIGTFRKQKPKL